MHFRMDREQPGWLWVDRGLDDKVDHFQPCEVCGAILALRAQGMASWQEGTPCGPCETRLDMESAIAEARGERPYNLDRIRETIPSRLEDDEKRIEDVVEMPYYP